MSRLNRKTFVVYLLAIFTAGVVAGWAIGNAYGHRQPPAATSHPELARHLLSQFQAKLRLTAEQRESIRPLVEQSSRELSGIQRESWRRVAEIRQELSRRVSIYLTPGQQQLLEAMERERSEKLRRSCGVYEDPGGRGEEDR